MATILVTGGTGLIGRALCRALTGRGHEVIVLTRSDMHDPSGAAYAKWDISSRYIDPIAIQKADYVIHLAGANIGERRWTEKRKKEIISSRADGAALLVHALEKIPNKVRAVIGASGTDFYPPDPIIPGREPYIESEEPDATFLGRTCTVWEESLSSARQPGRRVVIFRTAVVLSTSGGMLKELLRPLKVRIAPIFGNGRQVLSWVHLDDLVRAYILAIENENFEGVYNVAAPNPVTNRELIMALAKSVVGRFFLPVRLPAFLLRLFLGEMSIAVLKSCTVSAKKLEGEGFAFIYSTIGQALAREVQNAGRSVSPTRQG